MDWQFISKETVASVTRKFTLVDSCCIFFYITPVPKGTLFGEHHQYCVHYCNHRLTLNQWRSSSVSNWEVHSCGWLSLFRFIYCIMVALKSGLPIANLQLYHSFYRLTLNQQRSRDISNWEVHSCGWLSLFRFIYDGCPQKWSTFLR